MAAPWVRTHLVKGKSSKMPSTAVQPWQLVFKIQAASVSQVILLPPEKRRVWDESSHANTLFGTSQSYLEEEQGGEKSSGQAMKDAWLSRSHSGWLRLHLAGKLEEMVRNRNPDGSNPRGQGPGVIFMYQLLRASEWRLFLRGAYFLVLLACCRFCK